MLSKPTGLGRLVNATKPGRLESETVNCIQKLYLEKTPDGRSTGPLATKIQENMI